MPHSKNKNFYQNRPKIKIFLQNKYKFSEHWRLRSQTPKQPPIQSRSRGGEGGRGQ